MTKISSSSCSSDNGDDAYLHGIKRPSLKPITMLSSRKYKAKEERKRILKLSVHKLKEIEDPETFLRRSVLINNTMKRLQTEVKEEKNIRKKNFYSQRLQDFAEEPSNDENDESSGDSAIDVINDYSDTSSSSSSSSSSNSSSSSSSSEDEPMEDDSDLILREVYMPPPPTPQMITSLEESDDLIKIPSAINKKPLEDDFHSDLTSWANSCTTTSWLEDTANMSWVTSSSFTSSATSSSSSSTTTTTSSSSSNNYGSTMMMSNSDDATDSASSSSSSSSSSLSATTPINTSPDKHYTCGQTSLFGELQSVVFNSLIASLET